MLLAMRRQFRVKNLPFGAPGRQSQVIRLAMALFALSGFFFIRVFRSANFQFFRGCIVAGNAKRDAVDYQHSQIPADRAIHHRA
jgi:hypothetical protein